MATLVSRISDLATRIATELKAHRVLINGNVADLSALNTTAKGNLVAAVNELKAAITAAQASSGAPIDDTSPNATATTYSASKINAQITAALNGVLSGAPAALDTLKELADAINDDPAFASTVTTALGNRVRFDAAQTLTAGQQAQAKANIDAYGAAEIGAADTNFVTTFTTGLS